LGILSVLWAFLGWVFRGITEEAIFSWIVQFITDESGGALEMGYVADHPQVIYPLLCRQSGNV